RAAALCCACVHRVFSNAAPGGHGKNGTAGQTTKPAAARNKVSPTDLVLCSFTTSGNPEFIIKSLILLRSMI
ncbi:MAG TPA: hypothetical protein VJN44_19135, partial [Roseateles sp.]|nr:hypothetical protein [Roseateles sp.]